MDRNDLLPSAPPKPSTDALSTYDSSTTTTTARATSLTPADSNTSYTFGFEELVHTQKVIGPWPVESRPVSERATRWVSCVPVLQALV